MHGIGGVVAHITVDRVNVCASLWHRVIHASVQTLRQRQDSVKPLLPLTACTASPVVPWLAHVVAQDQVRKAEGSWCARLRERPGARSNTHLGRVAILRIQVCHTSVGVYKLLLQQSKSADCREWLGALNSESRSSATLHRFGNNCCAQAVRRSGVGRLTGDVGHQAGSVGCLAGGT